MTKHTVQDGLRYSSNDFELNFIDEEWVLSINELGEQQVIPLELMVTIHGIIQNEYSNAIAVECNNCHGTGRDYSKRTPGVFGFKIPRCTECKGNGVIRETIS